MKYAVNEDGIDALRTMAIAINESNDNLKSLVDDLKAVSEKYRETLGPHFFSLDSAVEKIENMIKQATEPIGSISSKLNDVAEAYTEIVEKNRLDSISDIKNRKNAMSAVIGGIGNQGVVQNLQSKEDKVNFSDHNSGNLQWTGLKGNSKRIPKDSSGEIARELSKYNIDGIEYKNGEPDFSPVSSFSVGFNNFVELYCEIGSISIKNMDSRDDLTSAIRTKWQSCAKNQLFNSINNDSQFAKVFQEKTGIDVSRIKTREDLEDAIKDKGLTLHETPDCSSIQLVNTKIHHSFKHMGGVSEMTERLLSADLKSLILG